MEAPVLLGLRSIIKDVQRSRQKNTQEDRDPRTHLRPTRRPKSLWDLRLKPEKSIEYSSIGQESVKEREEKKRKRRTKERGRK